VWRGGKVKTTDRTVVAARRPYHDTKVLRVSGGLADQSSQRDDRTAMGRLTAF